eukprot:scaffold281_cov318-Pavlova_lutheri.AAC.59
MALCSSLHLLGRRIAPDPTWQMTRHRWREREDGDGRKEEGSNEWLSWRISRTEERCTPEEAKWERTQGRREVEEEERQGEKRTGADKDPNVRDQTCGGMACSTPSETRARVRKCS